MKATVQVFGPFKVLDCPVTLLPKGAKPVAAPDTGPPEPVAWWKFDESEGDRGADASSHRLNCRLQGKTRWNPGQGKSGGALELGGGTGYADCGGVDEFNFQEGMTVSAWIKTRSKEKNVAALVTKGSDTWRLQWQGDKGRVHFAVSGPEIAGQIRTRSAGVNSKRPMDDGEWHQVTGLYDGKRVALYVDGVLEDSVAASGLVVINTEPVWIGQDSATGDRAFNGWVDDARLYRQGLSEKQVQALYRTGVENSSEVK